MSFFNISKFLENPEIVAKMRAVAPLSSGVSGMLNNPTEATPNGMFGKDSLSNFLKNTKTLEKIRAAQNPTEAKLPTNFQGIGRGMFGGKMEGPFLKFPGGASGMLFNPSKLLENPEIVAKMRAAQNPTEATPNGMFGEKMKGPFLKFPGGASGMLFNPSKLLENPEIVAKMRAAQNPTALEGFDNTQERNSIMNQLMVDKKENNEEIEDNAPMMPNYYAEGGMVENEEMSPLIALMGQNEGNQNESKPKADNNPYPSLAEMIRQQGEGEDTVLAHINPVEAEMLRVMNGGTINPVTGLPQFGFGKWLKSVIGPAAGVVLGNILLPGIGGVIGGAMGGGIGSMARGRNDMGQAMLRGGAMGAMLPTAASLAGSGASALGAKGLGATLSNYGAQNAILPSIGLGSLGSSISGASAAGEVPVSEIVAKEAAETAAKEGVKQAAEKSFTDMLVDNSKNFFSKPQNLMTAAVLGGSLMNRPKPKREKSPEEQAADRKRYEMALMLTPQEQAAKEAADLAAEQSRRRVARNKFLPEERFNIEPLHVKTNSPEDYKRTGRWLEYYNNPQFSGSPIMMKEGGEVKPKISYEIEQFSYPSGLGFYVSGETKGQDDKIPAMLSDGEYVIPADTVAHLGDGNNNAGAKKLDEMIKKIRGSKGMKNALPPKAKSLTTYLGV